MGDTRERILDVAIEVLGKCPDAAMGDVATAAGVVRRTVYGHFPSRYDLVLALTERAVSEIETVLTDCSTADDPVDVLWVDFIERLWPLVHRYRVLVVLRRGEFGEHVHSLLGRVEGMLADLVGRGQASKAFGHHLPANVLSQVAWSTVFAIADNDVPDAGLDVSAPTMTTLLLLGVPEVRARALLHR